MTIHLESGVAGQSVSVCDAFIDNLTELSRGMEYGDLMGSPDAFDTARQIGTVYSLFAGEDLRTMMGGFVDQASAMAMLFAAAGGLIDAQDEALAAALGKASEEPAGLQSLGLLGSLTPFAMMINGPSDARAVGGYDRVGPENVEGAPLARMVSGAQALQPEHFQQVSDRVRGVAAELRTAGEQLHGGLGEVLTSGWQGEFASQASTSVRSFTESVALYADVLDRAADKASIAQDGFGVTRTQISAQASELELAQTMTPGGASGAGAALGPASRTSEASMAAARAAAEDQARAIVNTVYSPAVMDANLADLDIPAPYRVVSTSALGGARGIDLASAWNIDGVIRPAGATAPSADALAAAGAGGTAGTAGAAGAAGAAGTGGGMGLTTTSPPAAAIDAATEQALLASRSGTADGGAAGSAPAGQAGAGGGINASTQAAGVPFSPVGSPGQPATGVAGATGGIRGVRNGASGTSSRDRDRGFGSAAGLLGGGGAAAAGAGASRMGGAGTLAGLGGVGGPGVGGLATGGPGAGGPAAGAPGAGSAGGVTAKPGAGAFSSSTGGAQAGRPGAMPVGGMMGAAGAGQNDGRRGHTPAGYLTNATNTSAILGDPVKVAPAVIGRTGPIGGATAETTAGPSRESARETVRESTREKTADQTPGGGGLQAGRAIGRERVGGGPARR